MPKKLKVALITGGHPYEVIDLHDMFRSMPDIDVYPQSLDEYSCNPGRNREYDALVFYTMHRKISDEWYNRRIHETVERLGETGQGIFMLHHALLAFPEWKIWSDIVGIDDRSFRFHVDQQLTVQIADDQHPITAGMSDWVLRDETYLMNNAGEDSRILLTTEHPSSMRTLAWTRRYKQAPVFCFQSGHNHDAFANPGFKQIVLRGIRWLANVK